MQKYIDLQYSDILNIKVNEIDLKAKPYLTEENKLSRLHKDEYANI